MKQVTKTYNVFSYEELNKEAQKKAVEKAYTWLSEERCDHLKDDILEEMNYLYNIVPDNLFYSLSYSQGDGLCFTLKNIFSYTKLKDFLNSTGKLTDLNAFEKAIISELDETQQYLVLEYLNSNYNISIRKISWNYEHSHTCDFTWDYYENNNTIKEKAVNDVIKELCSSIGLFRKIYDEICRNMENLGYEIAYPEEDEVVEYINLQEFEYLEDGTLFNE